MYFASKGQRKTSKETRPSSTEHTDQKTESQENDTYAETEIAQIACDVREFCRGDLPGILVLPNGYEVGLDPRSNRPVDRS
jgi:hypothetical protein